MPITQDQSPIGSGLPTLRIGEFAPNFSARSTQGPLELADYRGRWVILVSHPADFTPVCTSEFVALAETLPRLEAMNCALLAVSVDSLYSHLAWLRLIHDRFGARITFPVIEDPTLEIARAYGMIGPDCVDAASVRFTFFLDPEGILRASTCYPAEVGRSIPEIVRVLAALQRTAEEAVLTPANWCPGDDLLELPGSEVSQVLAGDDPCGWFYTTRPDEAGKP
jgi:peroxiredoxin (alkyl hydroperoxide reductase subunit C)